MSETQVDQTEQGSRRLSPTSPASRLGRMRPDSLASRRFAAAGIAILACVVLGAAVQSSVQTIRILTAPSLRVGMVNQYRQFLCLQAAFRREVPRGATFVIDDTDVGLYQLVGEISALWATATPDVSAPWHVSIVPGPECDGDLLNVVHKS